MNKTTLDNYTRFFGNRCNADDKLEEIKYFHSEIETLIKSENSKLTQINIDFEDNSVLYNRKFHFDNTLAHNLRLSVIVNLVTFLEVELQNYCCDLQTVLRLTVKYNEFKGTILEQFKIYTNKIASLQIDFSSSTYQKVKQIIELRNCIVHYEGQTENFYGRKFNRSDAIVTLAKEIPSIEIKENDFISLNSEACINCISIIEKFIDMIYKCALERFPKNEE